MSLIKVKGNQMNSCLKKLKVNFFENYDEIFAAFACLKKAKVETFYLILLADDFKIIAVKKIASSESSKTQVIVQPKKILKECFLKKSSNIVILHNHPSGFSIPSEKDIYSTHLLKDRLLFFEINLVDHIIIGETNFSFKKANLL